MTKGKRRYVPITEKLILDTLGDMSLTTKELSEKTGCSYISVSYLLASMYRDGVLDRSPPGIRPMYYWKQREHLPVVVRPEVILKDEVQYLIQLRNSISRRLKHLGVD